MAEPKGLLIVPVGFNPDSDIRALTVDANDYLNLVLSVGLTGGGMGDPKGNLATLVGFNPDGDLRALELDANDNLLTTLLGGAAWQVLRSDGTDAEWDDLSDVLENAILTSNGDLIVRNASGAVVRLPAGSANQILGLATGIPAWEDGSKKTLTATGDLLYASSGNTLAKLAIGTAHLVLTVASGLPSWAAGSKKTLTAAGDILYASGANTLAKLAKGSDDEVLTLASGLPSWAAASGGYTEGCRISSDTDLTISTGTSTILDFNEEDYDTDGMHDNSTNNSRITFKTAGKYLVCYGLRWEANATSFRRANMPINGGASAMGQRIAPSPAGVSDMVAATLEEFAVDDYIEIEVRHEVGSDMAIKSTGASPVFSAARVG